MPEQGEKSQKTIKDKIITYIYKGDEWRELYQGESCAFCGEVETPNRLAWNFHFDNKICEKRKN